VAHRSIEMHEYRQALMRLRQGGSERGITRSDLMGRAKAARFRTQAQAQGWLEPTRPLPPDAEIAHAPPGLGPVGPHRLPLPRRARARPGRLRRGDPRRPGERARLHRPQLQRPPPDRRHRARHASRQHGAPDLRAGRRVPSGLRARA